MDAINLINLTDITNLTFIGNELQTVISEVSTLLILFKALGGIFIVWLVFSILRLLSAKKQEKMLAEMKEDIKAIKRKLRLKN